MTDLARKRHWRRRLLWPVPRANISTRKAKVRADLERTDAPDEQQQSAGSSRSLPLRLKSDHVRVRRLAAAAGAHQSCRLWPLASSALYGASAPDATARPSTRT